MKRTRVIRQNTRQEVILDYAKKQGVNLFPKADYRVRMAQLFSMV